MDDAIVVEDGEQRVEQTSVLVISHSASIVTLPCQVKQSVEGYVVILVKEHLHIHFLYEYCAELIF